jgi:hypothetical protein
VVAVEEDLVSHEYFYTSVPRGLQPGSRGYCVVAMTRGLPPLLAAHLEDLSGYKPLFAAQDPGNPVNWGHHTVEIGGKVYHILTRVAAAGLDYSERSNKFAHHVVLTEEELPAAGPAWLLQQEEFMETAWGDAEPRWLPVGRTPPQGDTPTRVCQLWEQTVGDAGWAGVLAETVLAQPPQPVIVLHRLETDVLALFAEAVALLPAPLRWRATFSTLATSLPAAAACLWRAVPLESPEASETRAFKGALVLNLGAALRPAEGGPLVEAARTGRPPKKAASRSRQPSPSASPAAVERKKQSGLSNPAPEVHQQISLATLDPSADTADAAVDAVEGETPKSRRRSSFSWTTLGKGLLVGIAAASLLIAAAEFVTGGAVADLVRGSPLHAQLKERDTEIQRLRDDNQQAVQKINDALRRGDELASANKQLTAEKQKIENVINNKDGEVFRLLTLQREHGLAIEKLTSELSAQRLKFEGELARLHSDQARLKTDFAEDMKKVKRQLLIPVVFDKKVRPRLTLALGLPRGKLSTRLEGPKAWTEERKDGVWVVTHGLFPVFSLALDKDNLVEFQWHNQPPADVLNRTWLLKITDGQNFSTEFQLGFLAVHSN